ncbi:hypothetical protein ARMSODRAFT_1019126 [Armillaria solidipes]|uniref:RING-type domain-containing protein n=1 Tax=Armillaria solidipes TaxID=1076256 RepID=A0A2H3BZ11_9AGAR|nr:hypothetical protein ARMSODRAFT_1019126 [Armillaria solidipes]
MSTCCVCSICLPDFIDPVCTPCGHVYCSRCITEATSIQRNQGSVTAPCPTCRKSFSINDDPRSQDFREYFGYPLRRLYVNGLRVNFEDKVNRLEDRIATLERECQRLRLGNRNLLLPPGHLRQQGPGFPPWAVREERDASRMRWLAKGFIFGLMILAGSIADLTLYDAFGGFTLHSCIRFACYYKFIVASKVTRGITSQQVRVKV